MTRIYGHVYICAVIMFNQLNKVIMKAIVKTSSNYKNVNGKELSIVEAIGNRVTCEVPFYGFNESGYPVGRMVFADFSMGEVVGLIG